MKLKTCQEHLHAIISEVPHHQRKLIGDEYKSERDEGETEPSPAEVNLTPPLFISEMISLREETKSSRASCLITRNFIIIDDQCN
jgi:hypothetical protein